MLCSSNMNVPAITPPSSSSSSASTSVDISPAQYQLVQLILHPATILHFSLPLFPSSPPFFFAFPLVPSLSHSLSSLAFSFSALTSRQLRVCLFLVPTLIPPSSISSLSFACRSRFALQSFSSSQSRFKIGRAKFTSVKSHIMLVSFATQGDRRWRKRLE